MNLCHCTDNFDTVWNEKEWLLTLASLKESLNSVCWGPPVIQNFLRVSQSKLQTWREKFRICEAHAENRRQKWCTQGTTPMLFLVDTVSVSQRLQELLGKMWGKLNLFLTCRVAGVGGDEQPSGRDDGDGHRDDPRPRRQRRDADVQRDVVHGERAGAHAGAHPRLVPPAGHRDGRQGLRPGE